MENKQLDNLIHEVDIFKADNTRQLKKNINTELSAFKNSLPKEVLTSDLDQKIEAEVDGKLVEFNQNIDLKPKALYYSLKAELELDDTMSESDLIISAYSFLEKNTKNKFLKKILRELKKENKHE